MGGTLQRGGCCMRRKFIRLRKQAVDYRYNNKLKDLTRLNEIIFLNLQIFTKVQFHSLHLVIQSIGYY
ncbi:MAG TPA: hypothetical protein DEF48_09515 [Nostoc sp. UBA8866]|nr:hypothetical protein [Nostoc sp. UBA8866]